MSNPRTTWSKIALIPPVGKPERILQDQKYFRTIYQRKDFWQIDEAVKELTHTLNQAFESLNCKGKSQFSALRPQLAPTTPNQEAEYDLHFSKQLCRMLPQKGRRRRGVRTYGGTQRAVKKIISDLFITRTAEIENRMENALYQYIETLLTTMAERKTLKEIFDHGIESWTQSTSFMGA